VTVLKSVVTTQNEIAFSVDGSTLYVADANSTGGRPLGFHPASLRNVWAFDVTGSILSDERLLCQTENGWPDRLQVTRDGSLLAAVPGGVDVIDSYSGILLRKTTPRTIFSSTFIEDLNKETKRYAQVVADRAKHIYKVFLNLSAN